MPTMETISVAELLPHSRASLSDWARMVTQAGGTHTNLVRLSGATLFMKSAQKLRVLNMSAIAARVSLSINAVKVNYSPHLTLTVIWQ